MSFFACISAGVAVNQVTWMSGKNAIVVKASPPPSPDYYLAYSHGGVDDYVAFYDLRGAMRQIRGADVIFLGSSHVKYAFLRPSLEPFFARNHLKYYVMAFGYGEGAVFPDAIIQKFNLHPKYVVISAAPFFNLHPTSFAQSVMASSHFGAVKFKMETDISFNVRRQLHRLLPYYPLVSLNTDWIEYRSYQDGTLNLAAYDGNPKTYASGLYTDAESIDQLLPMARKFKGDMDRRGINIVLTCVPPDNPAMARGFAKALNLPLILTTPRPTATIDGEHLSPQSAKEFGDDFLSQFQVVIDAQKK